MAYSYVFYDGDDTTDPITVPFPYISIADISLWVDGVEADFTWTTSSTITPEEAVAAGTANVEVRRTTNRDTPEVTFVQGATEHASDLNTAVLQSLYICQELLDSYGVIVPTATTNFLFGTFAARPSAGTVNRVYVALDTGELFVDDGADWITPAVANHTGDVTGSDVLTIAANAVTNAKLAQMGTAKFKGRTTAGTGDPEDLTATQATAMLNVVTNPGDAGGVKGLVPAPAAGDGAADKYLKADGTWATVPTASATVQASTAEIAAQTAVTKYVSPDRAKHHPGVAKAWVSFNGTGSLTVNDSHGVTSVTDLGVGSYRINLSQTMANANYCVVCSCRRTATTGAVVVPISKSTTQIVINTRNLGSSMVDCELVDVAVFGDI